MLQLSSQQLSGTRQIRRSQRQRLRFRVLPGGALATAPCAVQRLLPYRSGRRARRYFPGQRLLVAWEVDAVAVIGLISPRLACFLVRSVSTTPTAIFVELDTIWIVSLVLLGLVVTVFTFTARERDFCSYCVTSHSFARSPCCSVSLVRRQAYQKSVMCAALGRPQSSGIHAEYGAGALLEHGWRDFRRAFQDVARWHKQAAVSALDALQAQWL